MLRANGSIIDIVRLFPFMLSSSKHFEVPFFSSPLDIQLH
jgi:hypothetical protein